jgi:hypothetical protein
MTRKLWVLGIVAIVGASVALAGLSNTLKASACDESNKTASATHSCCAKDGAKTASVDAKKVHNSMIKSAVVAPGAAPILNIAAFGAMLAGGTNVSGCEWCPNASMTAADCAAHMSASECAAHMSAQNASATVASTEHAGCGMSLTTAAHDGCTGASMAMTASASCCDKEKAVKTASAGGAGCCAEKSANTASKEECTEAKTASLKGLVDEMPYRENKRVTLAGAYACGHCTLQKTADCSPMLKTADGKVYPLLKNSLSSELKDAEGKNVQVSGTVKKLDGVKFLDVKSYKVL